MRADPAAARAEWIQDAQQAPERARREQSDFLSAIDSQGDAVDFHALRHTFITNLAASGVHPKVAQELARHSTITLTLDRYTHSAWESMTDALGRLPDFRPVEREAQRATGTDGKPSVADCVARKGTVESVSAHRDAIKPNEDASRENTANTGENGNFPEETASTPGRIRTCDLRIRSPLLYPAELQGQGRPFLPDVAGRFKVGNLEHCSETLANQLSCPWLAMGLATKVEILSLGRFPNRSPAMFGNLGAASAGCLKLPLNMARARPFGLSH